MKRVRRGRAAVVIGGVVLVLGLCGRAVAFNPQPGPQGTRWRIEGFADLLATTMETSDTVPPFGVDPAVVGDEEVDFSAGMIALFDAPDNEGDGRPDDGAYPADLQYFLAEIGDTTWDHTMPNGGLRLQVEGGLVAGVAVSLTDTMPAHPDLAFMLPASPGTWKAVDERNGLNLGTIEGTYTLRDGTVPEPATLALLGLGAAVVAARRRRASAPRDG
jgi:hypothetical protein